jgi:hypothetical protein
MEPKFSGRMDTQERPNKTLNSDGTTHTLVEPLDFMLYIPVLHPLGDPCLARYLSWQFVIVKLAVLVFKPRDTQSRYQEVLFPNIKYRVDVTPANHVKGSTRLEHENKTMGQYCQPITRAPLMKRLFNTDCSCDSMLSRY